MLFLLIVCLMKLFEMYSNNHKQTRNKSLHDSTKENLGGSDKSDENSKFSINYFYDIDQSCADQLKEFLQRKTAGINSSYRGMTDNSTNQPASVKSKLIKTGLLSPHHHQQAGFQPKPLPLLKQPLSSLNTNHLNQNNNNNYYNEKPNNPCCYQSKPVQRNVLGDRNVKAAEHQTSDDDALKKDIQIVLNNIQNALLNQQKVRQQQQQQQQDQFYQHQDRFKHLNIFGGGPSPSNSDTAINQRNSNKNNNLYLRKMSMSPAECDSTNNNNMLGCSIASDFTHDNSDYQWFIDYGYRDGVQHHSILSSLSASYNGIGELSYYDDLARNIDVNLAEVDIENFRSEDINSLLKIRQNENVPRTLRLKEPTEIDNSICKSELLFSPVKESHISVDSLDNMMDGYPDDIILTCQANKNNYTIAFEGSCMYSDESYYDFPDNRPLKQNSINMDNVLHNNNINKIKANGKGDMTQSDTGFTTWSQLKKSSDHINIQRYPSGNNNNNINTTNTSNNCPNNNTITCPHSFIFSARKSSSMPNLKAILQQQQQQNHVLNVSEVATTSSQSSYDSDGSKIRTMLQNYPAPIVSSEGSVSPAPENSSSNNEKIPAPSFNLVKLFIKQKSSSSDTCMDVSSGCWPSDSTNSSTEHPGTCTNSSVNRLRKKSMNDSGKFSALSKHEEDAEYQLDSLDAHINGAERKTNDFNREIFDSPTHRRHYRDCSLNIRNQMKNPLLYNVLNNNSSRSQTSDGSRTSENLTQILLKDDSENGMGSSKGTTIPIDMITKSIQTSTVLYPKATMNTSSECKKLPQSHVKMIPPSFLSQLNKLGDQQQAPVYVIYPNYALPDLEFINHQPINLKKDIIMSPLSYQAFQGPPKMVRTLDLKQQKEYHRAVSSRKRPQSLDFDRLGQNQYSHVQDWNSLLTLLPRDYKKLLKNVPEVNRIASMEASISSQKPLFCMSPPIRRNTTGLICDCEVLFHQNNNHNNRNSQNVNSSSSGGSSRPPSSGYRGSSTLLTDSEMEELINGSPDAMKNMFVYQYDNVPDLEQQQRPQQGRRGILRRTNTTTNTPSRVTPNSNSQKQKRYSMLDQPKSPQQQKNFQAQSDKRKSLQDPNFYHQNDLEEYFNNIGGTKNFVNRLPNYMKARDDQHNDAKDLNQLLTELELNKALSSKLNIGQHDDLEEIEARLKAESILNDATKLRNEVSKNLTSRKVSFNHPSLAPSPKKHLQAPGHEKKFTTPPNSPQISQVVDKKQSPVDKKQRLEKEKQDKIQSNRFKRLQIQWELLSKEQSPILETQSNVTTPTGSSSKCQSKIPRPVSYPNSKQSHDLSNLVGGKNLRSPSKMQAPKKYTTTPTNVTSPTSNMSVAIPRTPNKQLHTTPKKSLPARPVTRTR